MAIVEKNGYEEKRDNEYLAFGLGSEKYGIRIQCVREIIQGNTPVTEVPYYPECVKGVIQLRDKIFPVIDMKKAFGMGKTEVGEKTCVIIVETQRADMLKCWETKNCSQDKCPAYGSDDLRCWMTPKTFCGGKQQGSAHEKEAACKKCEVHIQSDRNKSVEKIGLLVDRVHEVVRFSGSEIEPNPSVGQTDSDHIIGFGKKQASEESKVVILLNIDKISCL